MARSQQANTLCFLLQKLLQPLFTRIRRASLSRVTILLRANAHHFNPSQVVYRQHLTFRKPANCIWSRTLGNSCRSLGLEVTALEQITKTEVQLISTHVRGGGDGNCFLEVSNFYFNILAKRCNCLHLQSCCFGSPEERVVYTDTVAGMKKSWIQSNGNKNFHLLLYPQKHPALPSMLFQLTHNKQQPAD